MITEHHISELKTWGLRTYRDCVSGTEAMPPERANTAKKTVLDNIVEQNAALRLQAYSERYQHWAYPEPKTVVVEGAALLPQTVQTVDHEFKAIKPSYLPIFNGGVYDSQGLIVPEALHAHSLHHVPDHFSPPPSYEKLEGSWLYGGILMRHVGHMLTESIGRLWAFEKSSLRLDGVVFVGMNGPPQIKAGDTLESFVRQSTVTTLKTGLAQQMLQLFDIGVPIRIVDRPMIADKLEVPTQLMGLLPRDLIGGHATYRESLFANVERVIGRAEESRPKRIFISRSRFFNPIAASYFMEPRLDAQFAAAGYTVVHPESLSLKAQLQLYSTATHIVMAAGSAAHVAALAINGTQNVAVLQRDRHRRDLFARQLQLMGAKSAHTVGALTGVFWPIVDSEQRKYSARFNGVFDIDVKKLWNQLGELGFVTDPPVEEDQGHRKASIMQLCKSLEETLGCKFELVPPPT